MAAHQAPPSLGFSRQEHWSGLSFPSPMHESEKWKWGLSVVSDSLRPHGLQPTRLLLPWDLPGKSTGVGCHHPLQGFPEGMKEVWKCASCPEGDEVCQQKNNHHHAITLQCATLQWLLLNWGGGEQGFLGTLSEDNLICARPGSKVKFLGLVWWAGTVWQSVVNWQRHWHHLGDS